MFVGRAGTASGGVARLRAPALVLPPATRLTRDDVRTQVATSCGRGPPRWPSGKSAEDASCVLRAAPWRPPVRWRDSVSRAGQSKPSPRYGTVATTSSGDPVSSTRRVVQVEVAIPKRRRRRRRGTACRPREVVHHEVGLGDLVAPRSQLQRQVQPDVGDVQMGAGPVEGEGQPSGGGGAGEGGAIAFMGAPTVQIARELPEPASGHQESAVRRSVGKGAPIAATGPRARAPGRAVTERRGPRRERGRGGRRPGGAQRGSHPVPGGSALRGTSAVWRR